MTKADLKILENAFEREMRGGLLQTKSKRAIELANHGFLEFVEHREQTGLGIFIVEGYNLTHKGRIAYCETCKADLPHSS